ncbi:MAG: RecB family exonuclease [Candidatus Peregrinibacteria bacterium GW2011_GWA2_33_10]|nr:MAG: RecB family exonuclease [Candidatus Peregrinibacteria bacterium GW2011_GWA2_33_10]KKP39511.1 MAG: hypothetical protein UR30_C0010G0007 [Candidatus Peregrinibacteria bacterium GW2011_GWC2_33_13]
MESYIQISKINDFIFCPRSIYLHGVYEPFNQKLYHRVEQFRGKLCHKSIDEGCYSTAKKYLQGIEVASDKLGIAGKIDVYDKDKQALIERKFKIKKIFDGYKYQLYAQMICLEEMGFKIKKLFLHSISDNKRYEIPIPSSKELKKFNEIIDCIKNIDVENCAIVSNKDKCANCIYKTLCH